jgi:hypothetical protein
MKNKLTLALISLSMALICHHNALACNVCHSKNPKMVRMHEALEFKDCFSCHGPTAKKSADPPEKQMLTDDRCVRCHKK